MRSVRRSRMTGLVLGVAVAASACTGGSGGQSKDTPRPQAPPVSHGSTAPAGSPSGTPAISPAAYRRALTRTGRPITEALASIRAARSQSALSAHLRSAERTVGRAVTTLDAIQPPQRVDAQHADFVSALRTLDADLTELQSAVSGRELCASSSVLSRLRGLRSVRAVPQAARALQHKGFPTSVRMPATGPKQNRRLATGTFVRAGSRSGLGRLQIQNNGTTDAVVSLVSGGVPSFAVYVRAGGSFTVKGISDGTYNAYFTTGKDWDAHSRSFTRSCSFTRYDDTFPYVTTPTTSRVWSITLAETIDGNAKTSQVDPKNYPGG